MSEDLISACAGSYAGVLVMVLLSYLPLFLFRDLRTSTYIVVAFVVAITAHHLVSAANFWYWPLPGADLDAYTFHKNAIGAVLANQAPIFSVGTEAYEAVLNLVYRLFGTCLLVGQSLTVFSASIGCVVVLRIAKRLKITDERLLAVLLLLVAFTPSFLFFISLTFRESFQLLAFVFGLFFAVKAIEERAPGYLVVSAACLLVMGLFHHILLSAAFVMIFLSILFYLTKHRVDTSRLFTQLAIFGILTIAMGYWVTISIPAGEGNDYVRILRESGGVVEMIERYRHAVERNLPRSTFGYSIDATSVAGLVGGLSRSYASFLFGPGLDSIRSNLDIVPFINSVGRIVSVLLVVTFFFVHKGGAIFPVLYLSINYLFVTFLWSMGTTNYGQAFRHNAMSDWILALLLFHVINRYMSRRALDRR